jgi:RimJ/RimL family protein N-acetyltransferase
MIEADRLPTLPCNRVSLRWLTQEDGPDVFEIFSHPEVMRFWSSPAYTEPGEASDLIAEIHEHFRAHRLYQWGIALNDVGRIIGTCTLAGLDPQNRRAEIGFALNRDYWGSGYVTEALTTLLHFAFEELGFHRLEADVDPRNETSLRLLERLGFQREGYLRERWIVGEEINDTVFLALLEPEWRARVKAS